MEIVKKHFSIERMLSEFKSTIADEYNFLVKNYFKKSICLTRTMSIRGNYG